MSVRENIASNLLSVISSISSPTIKKATSVGIMMLANSQL